MKKTIVSLAAMMFMGIAMNAQTENILFIEDCGTGPYKAEMVSDESLPTHTIYRPQDIDAAVKAQGKLPVILYANGACVNNNVEMRYLLNEVASYGYIAIAIGPYDERDVNEQWKGVLKSAYPSTKEVCMLANGEIVTPPTAEEIAARQAAEQARREATAKAAASQKKSKKNAAPQPAPFRTYPKQMLEAMDWITEQNANPASEYYHCIDLDNVVAMGQSCGGAQTLAIAYDPRVKTVVMLNTGIGDMEMQGATKSALENLHTPIFYLIGGPVDVAYGNSAKDFERINHLPIVMINTLDGHSGTYYETHGGPYAVAVRKWLDWQLKGKISNSAFFLDDDVLKAFYPNWTVVRKNW